MATEVTLCRSCTYNVQSVPDIKKVVTYLDGTEKTVNCAKNCKIFYDCDCSEVKSNCLQWARSPWQKCAMSVVESH